MRSLIFALCLLLTTPFASAGTDRSGFAWKQHPGAQIPADVHVQTSTGQTIALRSLFHGTPVILDLGYFTCPSLCGIVRASLFDALDKSGLKPGRDVELAILSIDPQEKPADAAAAKARDLAAWPGSEPQGRHYLTASPAVIEAVTQSAGFPERYEPSTRDFLHPTGLVLLSGSGTISTYLLGVGYPAGDLRAGVIRARSGGIARAALPILLLCFHYDSATGRYTLVIMKLLRLMGILTILTLIGLFAILRRPRRAA